MKAGALLLFLILFLILSLGFAVANAGGRMVDARMEQSNRPESVTDTIMRSRQTAPIANSDGNHTTWFGAGLMGFAIVVIGSAIFILRGGSEFLRQWRLARKRPTGRRWRPLPPLPASSTAREIPNVPAIGSIVEGYDETTNLDFPE